MTCALPRTSSAQIDNGQPYADPSYCKALPDLIKSFEQKVIPEQQRMLRQQEARLQQSDKERSEAQIELAKTLGKAALEYGTHQVTTAKALRKRVEEMKTLTKAQRREWLERIKGIEDSGNLLKVFTSRHEYEMALRRNEDELMSFLKLVDDMGAADLALKGLANLLVPGAGDVIVKSIRTLMDVGFASGDIYLAERDAAQFHRNYERLKEAHEAVKHRVATYRHDLEGGLCGAKVANDVKKSPVPIEAPNTTQNATSAAATPAKAGGSSAKAIATIAAVGGASAGAAIAYNEYKKANEEYQGFLDSLPPSGGTSSGSGSGSGGGTGGGTGGSSTTTIVSSDVTCRLNSAGSGRNCNGTITARIGPSVTSGVTISALTSPIQIRGSATPSTTGAGQTLTFTITNSSTVPQCPSVTSVNFVRPPDTNTIFTSASGSIRITCN
jgi:hypothetical protein